jgi:hypothetical protein
MDPIDRREFLKSTGGAAALGLWPAGWLQNLAAQDGKTPAAGAKETVDLLLEKYRKHQRTGLHAGGSGGGNHIPMTLVAAYRMGAGPERLNAYAGKFKLSPEAKPIDVSGKEKLTRENWRDRLGRAGFVQYVDLFEKWTKEASAEAVLKEVAPVLANGMAAAFSHDLLRLGHAIDYGSREEIAYSLAGWAMSYRPSPDFDDKGSPVEPDELLSNIVKRTSDLRIKLDGGNWGPIAFRLDQVYGSKEFSGSLKPVRFPESEPLAKISELIMEAFTKTHDFTLLHAFTTCQASRLILPLVGDPRKFVSTFWHSACATYVTVVKARGEMEKDSVTEGKREWKDVFAGARDSEPGWVGTYEHIVKLAYSCWLESNHYKRERYLALAAREVKQPARFV